MDITDIKHTKQHQSILGTFGDISKLQNVHYNGGDIFLLEFIDSSRKIIPLGSVTKNMIDEWVTFLAAYQQKILNIESPSYTVIFDDPENNIFARIKVIIPPRVVSKVPIFTIRFANTQSMTLDEYFESVVSEEKQENIKFIKNTLKNGNNIIVAGGTGSGKTTLFNSMLMLLDEGLRVVVIEDIPELKFNGDDVVRLTVRSGSQNEYSSVLDDTLRLTPDRLIINELLIDNTRSFFGILLSGHGGIMTTLHAKSCSAEDIAQKLMFNAKAAGVNYQKEDIFSILEKTVVIHLERSSGKICFEANTL